VQDTAAPPADPEALQAFASWISGKLWFFWISAAVTCDQIPLAGAEACARDVEGAHAKHAEHL